MKPRIQNRFFLWTLSQATSFGETWSFWPLNQIARLLYCHPLRAGLQIYFRILIRDSSLKLIARHSATEKSAFNLFRSDLDLTIICSDLLQENDIEFLLIKYAQLRNKFIMLGEIEVYNHANFKIMQKIDHEFGDWIARIRWLRKLARLRIEAHLESSRYHQHKNELAQDRAFQRLIGRDAPKNQRFRELSLALERVLRPLSDFSVEITFDVDTDWFSHFLGWRLVSEQGRVDGSIADGIPTLTFRPITFVTFLAILPDSNGLPEKWKAALAKARQSPQVKKLHFALLTNELLTCLSVRLDKARAGEKLEPWIEHLTHELLDQGSDQLQIV